MTGTPPAAYNGRYELRSQVARGGTAQVYLARDLLLDRPVALKVLDPQLSTDHAFVERFRREAQAAANLSHPNIVPVFDWGESESTYFIVMEYVDGEALSSIIRTQAPLEPEHAASIAVDIAKALSYAHRHGVVHRDVKPGNVLITSDGQVKVTDFGIARAIGTDEQVTQTGLVMGTATYFSPEQAQGLGVDGRSDLYALGVVLYEMATGRPPFTGDTPVSIAYQHVQETPPRPRSINAEIPPALEAIILQAMAKMPAERYPNADDLRADLVRFLSHQPVLAKIPSEYAGSVAPLAPEATMLTTTTTTTTGATAPTERQRTTTPFWLAGAFLLAVVLAVTVVLGGRSLGYFGVGHSSVVPDVRGMSRSAAETKLHASGFNALVTHRVIGTSADQNTVISQSPASPDKAKTGSTVDLTVAGAAPTVTVPSVVGEDADKAQSDLKAAGFKVRVQNVAPTNPSQLDNQVVAQSPTGSAPKGSRVTISVVKTQTVAVPNLAGDSSVAAGAALSQAGFNVGTVNQEFSTTVPSGQVISSSPAAGTMISQGSPVDLVISLGAGTTVPPLVGDSETAAIAALQSAGLAAVKGAPIGTAIAGEVGNVAAQQPLAGTSVTPGSSVKYRIGVYNGPTTTTTTLPGNSGTGIVGTTGTAPVTGAN